MWARLGTVWIAAMLVVGTVGCGRGAYAAVVPSAPTPIAATAPAAAPASASATASGAAAVTFGSGQWDVGGQIAPGRYFADPGDGCYWERRAGTGPSFTEVIANELVFFNPGQVVVDILASDVSFRTKNCGTWGVAPRAGEQGTITPGTWLVGSQVAPGRYRASATTGCRWKRLRDFSGDRASTIAGAEMSESGEVMVTIEATDAGFTADAFCGEWLPAR